MYIQLTSLKTHYYEFKDILIKLVTNTMLTWYNIQRYSLKIYQIGFRKSLVSHSGN